MLFNFASVYLAGSVHMFHVVAKCIFSRQPLLAEFTLKLALILLALLPGFSTVHPTLVAVQTTQLSTSSIAEFALVLPIFRPLRF